MTLKIGITGGIGSGKSTVCRLFALYGVPVYDCDARAAQLMNGDAALVEDIKRLLGAEAYRDGMLDRGYVAGKVFANRGLLCRLDGLVHPAVGRDFEAWVARQQAAYVLMESAILFESGFYDRVDRIITVSAPVDVRISRVMSRDSCPEGKVRARIANQIDDALREARSDYTIVNDGRRSLVEQVAALHKEFSDVAHG